MQSLTIVLGGFIDMTGDTQCQGIHRTNIIYALCFKEDGYGREILNDMRLAECLNGVEYTGVRFVFPKYGHRHTTRSVEVQGPLFALNLTHNFCQCLVADRVDIYISCGQLIQSFATANHLTYNTFLVECMMQIGGYIALAYDDDIHMSLVFSV